MKKVVFAVAILFVASIAQAAVSSWDAFVIRNANGGGPAPTITDLTYAGQSATEFLISAGGMKAAWGTNSISGAKVGQITELSIDRLDDATRFTAGSGPAVAPYFNIWVTDGAGNYAVIANEPSNPEWNAPNNPHDITGWDMLETKTLKVYETAGASNGTSWVHSLVGKTAGLTFADVANLTIEAPPTAYVASNYPAGSGAPRELGTNAAYAFNWVFGDTLTNYVSGNAGYIVANPVATAVPEPGTIVMLAMAGLGLLVGIWRRR